MRCEHHLIAHKGALLAQRALSRHSRYFRVIILLRKMRQNEEFRPTIIVRSEEIRECVIRQVAHTAHHALLY